MGKGLVIVFDCCMIYFLLSNPPLLSYYAQGNKQRKHHLFFKFPPFYGSVYVHFPNKKVNYDSLSLSLGLSCDRTCTLYLEYLSYVPTFVQAKVQKGSSIVPETGTYQLHIKMELSDQAFRETKLNGQERSPTNMLHGLSLSLSFFGVGLWLMQIHGQ